MLFLLLAFLLILPTGSSSQHINTATMQLLKSPGALWGLSRSSAPSSASSSRRFVPLAQANNNNGNGNADNSGSNGKSNPNSERTSYNVRKGKQFENARRRKGRPAHLRSPYDSPLRDGNRDRLIGLLTERAAKTLMVYLMETNANVYSWLVEFYKKNPIPKNGSWDEVSGEAFLRKLLSMPIEEAKFNTGRDSLFDNVRSCGVDPRSIAQRIMDIRTQLSEEFIQELQAIAEENSVLLRETLQTSLASSLAAAEDPAAASKDSGSSEGKDASSSSKAGAVGTPPPSPAPTGSDSKQQPIKGSSAAGSSSSNTDSSSSLDAVDKAAAVAKLNAALKKTAGGAGSVHSSHPELQQGSSGNSADSLSSSSSDDSDAVGGVGGGDDKVDMADVLASLKRALEADVARDVLKMKESTSSVGGAAADSSSGKTSSSNGIPAAAAADQEAQPPTAAAAAAAEGGAAQDAGSSPAPPTLGPTAAAAEPKQEQQQADTAMAAAAVVDSPPAADAGNSSEGEDAAVAPPAATSASDSNTGVDSSDTAPPSSPTQLSSSAVGEAGTYSRMLPKGWGPRLGVGFSRYPRSRNNIVSTANLSGVSPKAAGDAVGGAAAAGAGEPAA